jgi:redox-sensitive bicupin YhaK (pirin superfamily)
LLKGQLQHEDSTGNKGILRIGEVQRMTAGTGIIHSEMYPSLTEEVHFLQLWLLPNEWGLKPSYEKKACDPEAMKNQLLPIVSSQPQSDHVAFIHQDLTIYLSRLEPGKSILFQQESGRRILFFTIEGDVLLNQINRLKRRNSARITEQPTLEIETDRGAFFMLIDLP